MIVADVKRRLILKHSESGLYVSWDPANMPFTAKLSQARRFTDAEEIRRFFEYSPYRPENPEEFEIVGLKITYEEEKTYADSQSGTEKSEIAARH